MEPAAGTAFCDIFRFAAENITEGLSEGGDASADGYWANWANFYQQVALDPLFGGYQDPIPILCTCVREYDCAKDITANSSNVRSKTVQDAVRSIAQMLTALGGRDPRLSHSGKID